MQYRKFKHTPEETRIIMYEAMNYFYGVRYILKYDKNKISDTKLVIISIFLAILRTDNNINERLDDIGITLGDLDVIFYDKNFEQKLDTNRHVFILNNDMYRYLYNRYYKELLIEIYTIAAYNVAGMMPEKLFPEFIFYYLNLKDMVKDAIIEDTLYASFKDDAYEDSQKLANELFKDIIDNPDVQGIIKPNEDNYKKPKTIIPNRSKLTVLPFKKDE